jgi:hypothetical protein
MVGDEREYASARLLDAPLAEPDELYVVIL